MQKDFLTKNSFLFLLGLVVFLNLTGLFNEIMEPDGALYASIAKQIAKSGDWLNLYVHGADWLDKPHLPFWLAALSFKLLGISAFAYKLPSFIFFIVSIYYCYKLAAAIYSKLIAQYAVLIYATALHIIISNFDAKVETYLTAFITGAIYYMFRALGDKWFRYIVAAAIFCACAIMTKGIYSMITIGAGFIIYWVRTKQWKEFAKPKWYLLLLMTFVFILPELYALYTQFDLHPEKIVFGKTGVSGIRFFFWDSQFGRFMNTGPITGNGEPSFFLHTTLWAFMPWSIILILPIINLFSRKKTSVTNNYRWIIGGSAIVSFILISLSRFQLPHYVVMLFPHFAMITAAYLFEKASDKVLKRINILQTVLFVILIAMITAIIIVYSFSNATWFLALLPVIAVATFFYRSSSQLSVFKKNTGFALLLAVFLNYLFYPSLLKYQAGMMAGKWLNDKQVSQKVTLYKCDHYSFDFYYNGTRDNSYGEPGELVNKILPGDSLLFFSSVKNLSSFENDTVSLSVLKTFPYFHVSQVNGQFINHKTRGEVLDTLAIALLKRKR